MMSSTCLNKCLKASTRYHNKGLKAIEKALNESDQEEREKLAQLADLNFKRSHEFSNMIMNDIREEAQSHDNQ